MVTEYTFQEIMILEYENVIMHGAEKYSNKTD